MSRILLFLISKLESILYFTYSCQIIEGPINARRFSIMYFSAVILLTLLSVATIKNTADAISVKMENSTVDECRAFVLEGFYKPMGSKEERSYIFFIIVS